MSTGTNIIIITDIITVQCTCENLFSLITLDLEVGDDVLM